MEFEDDSFFINPPTADDFFVERVKKGKNRLINEANERQLLSLQFKVIDIATPLLHLFANITDLRDIQKDVLDPLKAALQQWGRTFHHITKRRRHNIIMGGTPRAEAILDNVWAFCPIPTKYFAQNWSFISKDAWVNRAISMGLAIDFCDSPFQSRLPPSMAISAEMERACDKEVADLLEKNAITEVVDD